ncbi:MAG: hypothetical protein C0404_07115 [Verrucomicrobia bacterium]|nr:hypothetical protein [Verrucomicrobiota bacterium]
MGPEKADMKPEERQDKILRRLRALQREWRVEEIAKSLDVSPLTIRRDLDALASEGAILRTHGGCVYAGRMALDSLYHQRVALNFDLKEALGREAAKEIRPGSIVLINDGSTSFHLAAHLESVGRVTVYTNSIAMVPELIRHPGVRLYIIGGEYYRDLLCLGGSLMQKTLEHLKFDIVFLGADAVDKDGNCLVQDQETARITQMMLRTGRRKILLADHTKAAAGSHVRYGSLSDFDAWITTPGLPAADVKRFARMTEIKEARA